VCSDSKVGKNKDENDDISSFDLAYPATTNPQKLIDNFQLFTKDFEGLNIVFSTYQSLEVIAQAQKLGLPGFDLIICDEAHRTTGASLLNAETKQHDESSFVKIHDGNYIAGVKRLYMTATPRVYGEAVKAKAGVVDALLASMDDELLYGPEFHRLMFGAAVAAGLLTDYRVITLSVSEEYIADLMAKGPADLLDLKLDDVARIIGCYNGLAKKSEDPEHFMADPAPVRRAVAFGATIKASEGFTARAAEVVNDLLLRENDDESVRLEVRHVDGTQNVLKRNAALEWLKSPAKEGKVRILSNARCLSEGVDVPALDAVLFLSPRNSVVDVVQSVGRVMRKSPGKQYGYIIIPVAIPNFEDPVTALNENKRFKTVWQVLQALRSHDERFAAEINKAELNKKLPSTTIFPPVDFPPNPADPLLPVVTPSVPKHFNFGEMPIWADAVLAKLVSKVGQRTYWEDWAKDVAEITQRFQTRISALVQNGSKEQAGEFADFVKGLRTVINPGVTSDAAIEMLAQHMVTKPVFDALFEGYSFSASNPVSQVMEKMLITLEGANLESEAEGLNKFYASVRQRVEGIEIAAGKQQIIKELYDKFFQGAFAVTADKLGIVYTPVEVVDYMIQAVERVLNSSLDASLGDKGVHILDPFTGTGTFITRLLGSGLISEEKREHKFRHELHANEIVLLAYYIAAVNIEETFHGDSSDTYLPFEGLVLTDTFQMTEQINRAENTVIQNLDRQTFEGLSKRAESQLKQPIQVIISNPPYSVGQEKDGDGDANEHYDYLDRRVAETYKAQTKATNTKALDDSYIRAFRWASDRIGEQGVVCFVTGGGWLIGNAMDGMRRCLVDEFAEIFVLDLRGNQRTTQGEKSRREGGKIFGGGSRTAVTVTLLVKKKGHVGPGTIYYHDIGDYLSREEKLAKLVEFTETDPEWTTIMPNEFADWINQRRSDYAQLAPLGDENAKGKESQAIFTTFSLGVASGRDAVVYNFSPLTLQDTVVQASQKYEEVRSRSMSIRDEDLKKVKDLKWNRELLAAMRRDLDGSFNLQAIVVGQFRPFVRQHHYFDRIYNQMVYQMPKFYRRDSPSPRVIVASGVGSSSGFSCFMTDKVPNLHAVENGQCFPEFWYDDPQATGGMFDNLPSEPQRREGVSNWAAKQFSQVIGAAVDRETIFFYVYGILHSEQFREAYEDNLVKERPRIPLPKDAAQFEAFSEAGRKLSDLHLNYETVEPYPLEEVCSRTDLKTQDLYRVKKMNFPKGQGVKDRPSSIIYNDYITLNGIPDEAWDYMLSGKAALYWIIDRYKVTKDKESGIENNPNEFSEDPRYILDLVKRVVTVSIETLAIVRNLPNLTFDKPAAGTTLHGQ